MSASNNSTPKRFTPILGATFISQVMDADHPALVIGRDSWTKHEVATVLGVVHIKACSLLTSACKKLGATSTADVYKTCSPYSFAEFPCGVTTLYVLFAAFIAKGFDPEAWYNRGQDKAIVTFLTLKHRELQAAKRTREDEKKRQRSARAAKHRTDVAGVLHSATR